MPLVGLSDSELAAVMDAARPLAPKDRSEFLRAVASELAKHELLGPGVVGRVVSQMQRKYFDPPQVQQLIGAAMWLM
jgi:hypothetical protein